MAALADAGLTPADVDGISTFMMDNNPEIEVAARDRRRSAPLLLAHPLRRRRGVRGRDAGGARGRVGRRRRRGLLPRHERALACSASGSARRRPRRVATTETAHFGWYAPFGLLTPASWVAMQAQRYLHDYGATTEDFGRVSVACRRHAATNPARLVLRAADHARRPSGVALDRAAAPSARLLPGERRRASRSSSPRSSAPAICEQPPAVIRAAAQGASRDQQMMTSYYRDAIGDLPEMADVARELYAQSGLGPQGFPDRGHLRPLHALRAGAARGLRLLRPRRGQGLHPRRSRSRSAARFPINTHGGQLGEAYIHGMNGVAEGVRQVRRSAVNQVPDVEHVLVTAGTGVPTSAIILGR